MAAAVKKNTHGTSKNIRKKVKKKIPFLNPKGSGVDVVYLVILFITMGLGLISLYSASFATAQSEGNSYSYVAKQFKYAVAGIILMFLISKIDYRVLKRTFLKITLPYWFLLVSTVLLIAVFFCPPDKNGFYRWIPLPGIGQFQPSEITKFAVILFCAFWVDRFSKDMKKISVGIIPFFIVMGVNAALLLKQPHLSCTIIVLGIIFTMMYVGGARARVLIGLCIIVAIAGTFFILQGYQKDRIELWLDPFSDAKGKGWQTIQSLYAIGSGGFLGVGLGNSRQKYFYLPEPENDFIFSVICEETGFVGAVIVILIFVMLVFRGIVIATRAQDKFGYMLAVGISLQIGLQAMLNIAVVTNSIPNTGISLPFFSSGGTSLIMLLAEIGVLLSVSRTSTVKKASL